MKMYLLIVLAVLMTVAELGFIAPLLFSADSDELVMFGMLSVIIYLPAMYHIIRQIITTVKKEKGPRNV
jgi:hypothetical protein